MPNRLSWTVYMLAMLESCIILALLQFKQRRSNANHCKILSQVHKNCMVPVPHMRADTLTSQVKDARKLRRGIKFPSYSWDKQFSLAKSVPKPSDNLCQLMSGIWPQQHIKGMKQPIEETKAWLEHTFQRECHFTVWTTKLLLCCTGWYGGKI